MRTLGRTTVGQPPGPLGRGGRRWIPRPLSLSPLSLSNIGTWYVPRPFGATRTSTLGYRRATIGPLPLAASAAVALSEAAPSPVSLVVEALFLHIHFLHIHLGIGQPSDRSGCTQNTHWVPRPCNHLLSKTLRVTRYVRGETIYPRNFGSQSCYFQGNPSSNELGRHGGARPFQCRQTLEVTKQEGF